AGPARPDEAPYGLVGVGEGALAAAIAQTLIASSLTRGGTQFVLGSPDASALATDYADLAVVAGANARRVATGGTPEEIDVLVPGGPLATYHFAQFVAHASGHSDEAAAADALSALDPREVFTVEFLFRDGSIARSTFEAGDFAAGRAFLAMGQV
ncbi:MAG: hypothetical protein ACK4M6_16330, partial [Hyphomonas sp.]